MDFLDPAHVAQQHQLVDAAPDAFEFMGDLFQPIDYHHSVPQSCRAHIRTHRHLGRFRFCYDAVVLFPCEPECNPHFFLLLHAAPPF